MSSRILKQVIVFRESGRFGGWPANYGIWSWGNEILVGFAKGYHKELGPTRHNIDREKPEEHLFKGWRVDQDRRAPEGYIAATIWNP